MLRIFTYIWLVIVVIFSYEYFALNFDTNRSVLFLLKAQGILGPDFPATAEPGRPISWWLGWAGFGTMCLTNIYLLRKRVAFMKPWGVLSNWLDFHIFCGLVGPTFIVFHCNFKVGGLVGISFWSMVVSFASGIVGRYLYVNLLHQAKTSIESSNKYWSQFLQYADREGYKADAPEVKAIRSLALRQAGALGPDRALPLLLWSSLVADVRLLFAPPPTLGKLPEKTRYLLEAFAVSRRRAENLEPFKMLMGYWHTFHLPFAIFMYVVAVIHIISALFFGVKA